jgi:hypothetical protein
MAKKAKRKYSSSQQKAYYMGYGAAVAGVKPNELYFLDPRQGAGQRKDLCDSARAGYFDGKGKGADVPFAIGYKRYPVSKKAWYSHKWVEVAV